MRPRFTIPFVLLGSLAWGGAAAVPSEPVLSDAAFAALDPTQAGRKACGDPNRPDAILSARLRMASVLAESLAMGSAPIGLYSGISPSDLPLGDMDSEARRYFDQGLAFAYGFNHAAAIRSFRKAQSIDPNCAACWWGEALANGPNINAAMDGAQNAAALEALATANRLSAGATPLVKALIEAQSVRYSGAADADRGALDRAYAVQMLALSRANPQSDDLAVLAAESAMNTSPWNYWTADGEAVPLIAEAVTLIETVMARNPAHPQASHLYIHLLELPEPKKAEAAADRLNASGPKALAHLVHMPAHIYFRVGRYADSMDANISAVAADEAYLRDVGDDGLVRFGYYPHNVHFLLASAQMMGDPRTVVNQTRKLESIIDIETGRELYWVQAIYAAPYFAYAQYASSAATLALTETAHPLDYVDAMRHYARAVAHAQNRDVKAFETELAALEGVTDAPGVKAMEANGFPAPLIVRLAAEVARGRMAVAQSRPAEAIAHFSSAQAMQKKIPYNEPPFWYYPVHQSLGAAYFRAGRFDDAKQAFRSALMEAPNSALALYGLAQTERKLGNRLEMLAAERALDTVWRGESEWLDMDRI